MHFFLNTRIGQALILIVVTIAAVAITQKTLESRGYAKCEAAHAVATGKANVEIYDRQNERDDKSSAASGAAAAAAEKIATEGVVETQTAQEKIHVIYRDRPAPNPARCDLAVDAGVQDLIESAVDRANRTDR